MTVDVVTGAFGYSGSAVTRRLLAAGGDVRTLTAHPDRTPDGSPVDVRPLLLRHLPVFAVGGTGRYRIRAVHVDDLAALAVAAAGGRQDTVTDAVGPERPTFLTLVRTVRSAVGRRTPIVRIPGPALPPLAATLGLALHDVLLTGDEYRAMAAGLADTDGPATGPTPLSAWLATHGDTLGLRYANELDRHFR